MAGYHEDLAQQIARRDNALKSATAALDNAGKSVKNEVARLENGLNIQNAIAAHPWAAAGVALGAGLIVSRLLSSSAPSSAPHAHVVVEVRNNGGEVTAREAAPQRHSPMDFNMQAIAGFEAVKGLLNKFQDAQHPRAETAPEPKTAEPAGDAAAPQQPAIS